MPELNAQPPSKPIAIESFGTIRREYLTGFEGRCDAIYLTTDANAKPPHKLDAAMRAWRKKLLGLPENPPDAGTFDLVVIGGGTAGSCSAAAATQKGLKVALIQDRPVLGGNSSPEIRVPIGGLQSGKKDAKIFEVTKKNLALMKTGLKGQKDLEVFTWTHAFAVEKDGPRIKAVIAQHCLTGKELRFRAPLFVDCTGDDPAAPGMKVVRGGLWNDTARYATSASRWRYDAYQPVYNVGFRIAVEIDGTLLTADREK